MTIQAEPNSLPQRNILPRLVFLFVLTVSLSAVSFAGVTISSPQNGATVTSPVHVVATATSANPITSMRIYVDNVSVYVKAANRIDTSVPMAVGRHNVVVQAWDSKNAVFKSLITITVGSAPPPPPPTGTSGVVISSPANGATVSSPVHVVATASSANPITTMRIYVDNVSVFVVSSNKIDTLVNMAAGNHTVVVQAWDSKGTVFKSQITITVGTAPPPPPTGVTVSSPHTGATLGSPVHVVATAASANPITAMRIYLDNVSVFANSTNRIDTMINVAAGLHNMVVQAWDSTGAVFKTPLTITVNATTTLSAETSNNTSAADSFAGQTNGNAAAGNVSKVSTRTLLYSGSTTKIYAHFMPWFGSAKHMNPGYVSNDSEQIKKQVSDMVSRGVNGVIIDWYGDGLYPPPEETETDFVTMDHVTQLMMERAEQTSGFTFAVMYDVNALLACSGCDFAGVMITDLNHANTAYFNSPAYQKSAGRPVVYFFVPSTVTLDWTRVRNGVSGNPLFVFMHETGFTHAQSDGAFAWVKPEVATSTYLSTYYSTATASAKQSTGGAWGGFNDSLAPWGSSHPKVDQQCGQTWLKTFDEAKNHYSSSNQMSSIQLITWNDYEEGSEIETGINNCVTVKATVAGTVVSWSITGQASTLDHYSIFVSLSGDNLLPLKDVPVGTSSLDLAQFNLEPGSYLVYVKAIGKPSLTNKMSAGVSLIVPAR
jgi:Big-like domain-containing protein